MLVEPAAAIAVSVQALAESDIDLPFAWEKGNAPLLHQSPCRNRKPAYRNCARSNATTILAQIETTRANSAICATQSQLGPNSADQCCDEAAARMSASISRSRLHVRRITGDDKTRSDSRPLFPF